MSMVDGCVGLMDGSDDGLEDRLIGGLWIGGLMDG